MHRVTCEVLVNSIISLCRSFRWLLSVEFWTPTLNPLMLPFVSLLALYFWNWTNQDPGWITCEGFQVGINCFTSFPSAVTPLSWTLPWSWCCSFWNGQEKPLPVPGSQCCKCLIWLSIWRDSFSTPLVGHLTTSGRGADFPAMSISRFQNTSRGCPGDHGEPTTSTPWRSPLVELKKMVLSSELGRRTSSSYFGSHGVHPSFLLSSPPPLCLPNLISLPMSSLLSS